MNKQNNPHECIKRDSLYSEIQKLHQIYTSALCNDADGLIMNIKELQMELTNVETVIREKNIACIRYS